MKLAFSNIAWSPHDDPGVFQMLRANGISGIEVAPTKVWPEWKGATLRAASDYASRLRSEGFEIPALQAVLFARPAARLFDVAGEAALVAHLSFVAELASALGAETIVFGAPKQRDRGSLDSEMALARAADVFRALAEVCGEHGVCLCIEPNPRRYACNFVVNVAEALELVQRVAHPAFALHLDAAAMFLEGDELPAIWPRAAPFVRHFHISEPDLGDFRSPQVPHRSNLDFLDRVAYQGWCSVEMREAGLPLSQIGPWALFRGRN